MYKNLMAILACCCLVLISCKKDTANGPNPGGTSQYTMLGAPGSCNAPQVAGTYTVGTALTAANTVTLSVNVIVAGTYTIYTNSVNGVQFTGSGTFTSKGIQQVVLTGAGTALRGGLFYFVPNTDNSCNFSVSFSTPGSAAVYTYAGAPGNCAAPAIAGTYTTGVLLGSGNYVDLTVNVTTPGAYVISTNLVNGMRFTANGVFTAVGNQVVRLSGTGTPAASGNFSFTPANNGCSFSVAVNTAGSVASFTYDGAPGICTVPVINGTYIAGTALNASNTIVLKVTVTAPGSYNVSTNSSNGVVFSGSGNFSATGPNTITLTSTNTGTAAGLFTYTPTNNGCSFPILYIPATPPTDYLRCSIDGVPRDFSTNLLGTLAPGAFLAGGTLGTSGFQIAVTDVNGAAITPGIYNKFSLLNQTRFCVAAYVPDTGSPTNAWIPGLMNLNPFIVTIQTITANKVTGTFGGDLFDTNGANRKVITNGTFSVTY